MTTIHSSQNYSQPLLNSSSNVRARTAESGAESVDTQALLLGKLAEKIPGMSVEKLSSLKAEEFTPDKVAERIGTFVAAGLANAAARGASGERLEQMYQAAVKGVEKGFAEAREILDGLDMLQGNIASQIDETEAKTFDALAAIAPGAASAGKTGIAADPASQLALGIVERFSNAEKMELKVRTQDGDEVTIRFAREQRQESTVGGAVDGQGNAAASFSLSRSESSEYRFSVEGELDEGEIDALQSLIKDVSSLADEFFNGDVQKAFEASGRLAFDTSELASMQLDMSYNRQYARASSYEQVQQLDQPVDKPGRRLGQLMKALAESVGAPSLGFLKAPGQLGRELLAGLVTQDSRYVLAEPAQTEQYDDNLNGLLDAVLPPDVPAATETEADEPASVPSLEETLAEQMLANVEGTEPPIGQDDETSSSQA